MERGLIFHHDNAPVHTARLAPTDFYLLTKIQETLGGRRFGSTDEINEATSASLRHLADAGFGHVFDSWVSRWHKCVDNDGSYVE